MHRRTFLQAAAGLSAVAASAADDQPAVPIRLGFDTYSIRAFQWKAIQLIDYAASLKLDTIQISSLDDYESHEPAYLAQVKGHAAKVGIALDGGMGCICPYPPVGTPRTATQTKISCGACECPRQ